jgi:hypothetical protein
MYQPTRIEVGDVLSRTWEIFKLRWLPCVAATWGVPFILAGVCAPCILIVVFTSMNAQGDVASIVAASLLLGAVAVAASVWMALGIHAFMLRLARGEEASVRDLLGETSLLVPALLATVLAGADGLLGGLEGMNNFYLYQFQGTTQYYFIPWDKDFTFSDPARDIMNGVSTGPNINLLAQRLVTIPQYRQAYLGAAAKAAALMGGAGGWAQSRATRGRLARQRARARRLVLSPSCQACVRNASPMIAIRSWMAMPCC